MSRQSTNKEGISIFAIVIGFILAAIAWISHQLGLDFQTGIMVATRIIFFLLLVSGFIYLIINEYFKWYNFLPSTIVAFLLCWLPAFDYWSSQNFGNMGFDGTVNYEWYATGWIQALIAIAILVVGHGLIYYFRPYNRY